MHTPLHLTFRCCDRSDEIEIREYELTNRLERLNRFPADYHVVLGGPSTYDDEAERFVVTMEIATLDFVTPISRSHASREEHIDASA